MTGVGRLYGATNPYSCSMYSQQFKALWNESFELVFGLLEAPRKGASGSDVHLKNHFSLY